MEGKNGESATEKKTECSVQKNRNKTKTRTDSGKKENGIQKEFKCAATEAKKGRKQAKKRRNLERGNKKNGMYRTKPEIRRKRRLKTKIKRTGREEKGECKEENTDYYYYMNQ